MSVALNHVNKHGAVNNQCCNPVS